MKIWIRTACRPDKAACVNSKEGLSLQVIPPLCVPWGQLVALVGKSPCNKSLWLVPLCVLTWEFITHGYSGVDPGGGVDWVDWVASHPLFGILGLEIKKGNKTITKSKAILSLIVPISFCQVRHHPPSLKILDAPLILKWLPKSFYGQWGEHVTRVAVRQFSST